MQHWCHTRRALPRVNSLLPRCFSSTSTVKELDKADFNTVAEYMLRPEADKFIEAMSLAFKVDLTSTEALTSPRAKLDAVTYRSELIDLPISARMSLPSCLGVALYGEPGREFMRSLAELEEFSQMGPTHVLLRGSKPGSILL